MLLMNWTCVRLLFCCEFSVSMYSLDMPPAQDGQVSEATSSRSAVKTAVGTWGERGREGVPSGHLDVPSGHLGVPSRHSAEQALRSAERAL